MAEPTTLTKINNAVKNTISIPNELLRYSASEPLLTGPLLYILTRPVTDPLRIRLNNLLSKVPYSTQVTGRFTPDRLAKLISVLKVLFALGLVSRVNQVLNKLALNFWYPFNIGRPRKPWIWDGRTELVVITGGCSGFGYEMVKGFAGKARVVVLDISDLPKELAELPEVHYYRLDLTDFEAIGSTAQQIKNRHGNPTVLINNAGIGSGKTILETTTPFLESIMKVNLSSHFVTIKEFLPGMLEAKKGHVVTIASMASFTSVPGLVDYCVTKVGALALHEGLRNELFTRHGPAGHAVSTTSVHPSWHATGILKGFEDKLRANGIVADPPSNVANAVVEQVLAGRSGQIFMPRWVERQKVLRRWPIWAQDLVLGNVSLNPVRLVSGRGRKGFQF